MASLYATTVCLLRLEKAETCGDEQGLPSFRAGEAASVRMLPGTDELITGGESSPSVNGLKRAKIERQIFHAVGATVVEVNTRGDFS